MQKCLLNRRWKLLFMWYFTFLVSQLNLACCGWVWCSSSTAKSGELHPVWVKFCFLHGEKGYPLPAKLNHTSCEFYFVRKRIQELRKINQRHLNLIGTCDSKMVTAVTADSEKYIFYHPMLNWTSSDPWQMQSWKWGVTGWPFSPAHGSFSSRNVAEDLSGTVQHPCSSAKSCISAMLETSKSPTNCKCTCSAVCWNGNNE